jgi:hypothetical protein
MSMPVQPGGSRGAPMLEQAAQDTIAAARAQPRYVPPPEYERAVLTAEDKAEAEKAARERDEVCVLCGGYHALPSSPACPRLAGVELNGDMRIVKATFWQGRKWAEGRVVFREDLLEGDDDGV